jgi:outer membrane protein
MKDVIKYLAITLTLFYGTMDNLFAQDSAAQVLQLDDCIKIALTQSAHVLRSEDSVQITGAALMGAYGQFLPDLNFNSNYDYLSGNNLLTTTEPTYIYSRESQLSYQLTSTINIFNGFANHSALQAAILSKSA